VKKNIIVLSFVPLFILTSFLFAYNNNFNNFKSYEPTSSDNASFTLISTGDIGLGRFVNYQIIVNGDPTYPFLNIASYLKSADFTIINLESPLIKNCPTIVTGFKFCGLSQNSHGLIFAGIDGANLANNHTTNYGIEGLLETEALLKDNNIIPIGLSNEIKYASINGVKVAFVGFVELNNNWTGLSNATDNNLKILITEAEDNADVVIVSFHWGPEYTHNPSDNQIRLARIAIDYGADLILGNHSHWIQPLEKYKDKYISYAQGNTIFDQDWSQKTKEGVIYKFEYLNGKFEKIDEKYTVIENNSQPRFADEAETERIKSYITPL